MKKAFIYIPLLLLPALSSYAFQYNETDEDITITDTVYETDPPPVANSDNAAVEPPTYKQRTFNSSFKQKYQDKDFDYSVKKAPDNFFTRFLKAIREFFRNLFSGGSHSETNISLLGIIFKILGILLITGLVIVIIVGLVRGNFSSFFGKKSPKVLLEDSAVENLMEVDFASLIQKTENENNYRLAVRYYYLWLLQHLAHRGFIKWNTDKTNTDYYYEIYDSRTQTDFKYLSYLYDYIWYGEFDLDNTTYLKAKSAFRKTLNTI